MNRIKIRLSYLLLLTFLFIGCSNMSGYRIEQEIRKNAATFEMQHCTYVWYKHNIIECYRIPISKLTCEKVKQNKYRADSLISIFEDCN